MNYPPCENPNCKSYGKPHPNCRCHGGMAKGGIVKHFCSTTQSHKKGCQYFASGGKVELDPSSFIPDSPETSDTTITKASRSGDLDPGSFIPDSEHYGSTGQQVLTGIEGASQGVLGPLAAMGELGLSKMLAATGQIDPKYLTTKEDIAGRQKENPVSHMAGELAGQVGSIASGVGEAALLSKATAKMGSTVLKNAIPAMVLTGSDEITKSLLGIGDPNDAAASIMASGAFGGVLGKTMEWAGKGAGWLASRKLGESGKDLALGTYFQNFLNGLGSAHSSIEQLPNQTLVSETNSHWTEAYKAGQEFYKKIANPSELSLSKIAKSAGTGASVGGLVGDMHHAIHGAMIGAGKELTQGIASNVTAKAAKYATPAIIRALSSSEGELIPNLKQVINYASDVNKGASMISDGVNKLFIQPLSQQLSPGAKDIKSMEDLEKWISNGGINQNIQEQIYKDNESNVPGFAEGGIVTQKPTAIQKGQASPLLEDHDPIQKHFPDQNMILQGAKVRISNYLTSLQPNKNPPMLPFDRKPNQEMQKKKYSQALEVAVNPLSVLDKIQSGRLTKSDMLNLGSMYPELQSHLQKQITNRIVQAQIDGERPNKNARASLSLFMGAPMGSTMKQPMIAAAQATFSMHKKSEENPVKKTGSDALRKASDGYKTASDAGVARTQTSKL